MFIKFSKPKKEDRGASIVMVVWNRRFKIDVKV